MRDEELLELLKKFDLYVQQGQDEAHVRDLIAAIWQQDEEIVATRLEEIVATRLKWFDAEANVAELQDELKKLKERK